MSLEDLKSIEQIVNETADDINKDGLIAALIEREDEVANMMRMAGVQFGLYPQIMAKVFADLKFGAPISPEQDAMVQAQFIALLQAFQDAQINGTPPPTP